MLGQIIERARMELGETVVDSPESPGAGVNVIVSGGEGLSAGDHVVLARPEVPSRGCRLRSFGKPSGHGP